MKTKFIKEEFRTIPDNIGDKLFEILHNQENVSLIKEELEVSSLVIEDETSQFQLSINSEEELDKLITFLEHSIKKTETL